jgi:hypothetical protein
MEINEQDILDSISRNEKKSGLRLLGLLVVCLALGGLVLWFAVDNRNKTKTIDNLNKIINETSNDLNNTNDSLVAVNDSLTKLVLKYQPRGYQSDGYSTAPPTYSPAPTPDTLAIDDPKANYEKEIKVRKAVLTDMKKVVVYIQKNGEIGEVIAQTTRNKLRQIGYNVPKIEKVEQKANRVSYYFDEDKEYASNISKELIKILKIAGIEYNEKQFVPQKLNLKAKQRQIEVWVSF